MQLNWQGNQPQNLFVVEQSGKVRKEGCIPCEKEVGMHEALFQDGSGVTQEFMDQDYQHRPTWILLYLVSTIDLLSQKM